MEIDTNYISNTYIFRISVKSSQKKKKKKNGDKSKYIPLIKYIKDKQLFL